MLRTTILDQEHAAVQATQRIALSNAANITIAFDGWSDLSNASVYGANAIVPLGDGQRSSHLIDFKDVSVEKHSGSFLAGIDLSH
jgi:hypothetical protein